jgi:hypothetical protein
MNSLYSSTTLPATAGDGAAANSPAHPQQLYPRLSESCHLHPYPDPHVHVAHSDLAPYTNRDTHNAHHVLIGQLPARLTRAQLATLLAQHNIRPNALSDIEKSRGGFFCFAAFSDDRDFQAALRLNRCLLPDVGGYWVNTSGNPATSDLMSYFANNPNVSEQQDANSIPHNPITIEPRIPRQTSANSSNATTQIATEFFSRNQPPSPYHTYTASTAPQLQIIGILYPTLGNLPFCTFLPYPPFVGNLHIHELLVSEPAHRQQHSSDPTTTPVVTQNTTGFLPPPPVLPPARIIPDDEPSTSSSSLCSRSSIKKLYPNIFSSSKLSTKF